jgi:HK97 family phage portal protein
VDLFQGRQAVSGPRVSESTALSWTALAAGVRYLAETMAMLPIHVYERTGRDGRTKRQLPSGHPLVRLLTDEPNEEQTPFEVMELMQTHCVLFGNAYAQIVFDGGGIPRELWPLNPDRVQLKRNRLGRLEYWVSLPSDELGGVAGMTVLPADQVLHVRGFSRWGLIGERISAVFREAIGLGLATEEFAARFFGQGLSPAGMLQHPGQLSKEAQDRLRLAIQNQVGGIDKAHRLLILEEGMKWQQTMVEPEKAQFLELRQFQVTEASRILRIPPHMLYDLTRSTFSNIEHQGLELVTYTVLPWAVRWEQRLDKHLVSVRSRNTQFVKFNMAALLRGDVASRYNAYQTGRQGGWLSVNDIRALEDMNPVEGGDTYLEPVNMRPLGSGEEMPVTAPAALPRPPEDDMDDMEPEAMEDAA